MYTIKRVLEVPRIHVNKAIGSAYTEKIRLLLTHCSFNSEVKHF